MVAIARDSLQDEAVARRIPGGGGTGTEGAAEVRERWRTDLRAICSHKQSIRDIPGNAILYE